MADRRGGAAVLALVVVAVTTLVGCQGPSAADRVAPKRSSAGPTSPVATPSAVAESSPTAPPAWEGPVRSGATWPVVDSMPMGPPPDPWIGWRDPRDAARGWVDIRLMSGFSFELRTKWSSSPLTERAHPIEVGVVVDTDGDRLADCQIGLDNHAPVTAYSVWLKDLRTGVKVMSADSDAPPVRWALSEGIGRQSPFVRFGYAGAARSLPCDPFHGPVTYYAYAVAKDDGRVIAWDYAPDAAWLAAPRRGGGASRTS